MNIRSRRVLGIVGSPRRQGNTEILVDAVLSAAEEKGAQIQKVILSNLDIKPCRACDVCRKKGKCVHQDDFADIVERIKETDVLILGTPVYWWGPTAQFKAFLDRWYGIYDQGIFKGKETILVIPLGDTGISAYGPIRDMFKSIMDYLDMKHVGTIMATGVYEKGAINERQDFIASARKIGSAYGSVRQ